MGGKLAEPRTQTTNDFIADVAKGKGISQLWIGINDIKEEGTFIYGSNDAPITWTNWAPDQPNNGDGEVQEDCVILAITEITYLNNNYPLDSSKQEKWFDGKCDYTLSFVCERGDSTVNDDIELYINGYYDTSNKRLTEAKYCTDISENCDDIIKSHDGTVWNFFADMTVALQNNYKCIKITKDYAIVSSSCLNPVNGMVCRLDCCKIFSTILNIYE